MATKSFEQNSPNSTWNKALPDEPVFVIRASDLTGPETILKWIVRAEVLGVNEAKLREAFECAMAMRRYQSKKTPKTPD